MLRHYGFVCWVEREGKKLPVYAEEAEGNVKTAWIVSEVGKKFSVFWKDNSGKRISSSGHVFIDGKDVASAIIRPGRTTPVERSGVKKSTRIIRPFKFSELMLTDDEDVACMHDNRLKDVGTIKVQISQVKLGRKMRFEGYEAENLGYIHEKAKKAGAHCTRFSEETRRESRTIAISTEPYDPNEPGPYVTFVFRYRSSELLKATGIISDRSDGNPKKRPAAGGEVLEIESDDEVDGSHSSQQEDVRPEGNPSKRVKSESSTQEGLLVPSSRTLGVEDRDGCVNNAGEVEEPVRRATESTKEESDVEEEFDMLADDDQCTKPSQDNENFRNSEELIPPISCSPEPDTLKEEDEGGSY